MINELVFNCLYKIDKIQIAVKIRIIPKKASNLFIQAPGRGINLKSSGRMDINKYGSDNPNPIVRNIDNISIGPWLNAKLSAVPTKGAEQGVARTVANAPVRKCSTLELWFSCKLIKLADLFSSQRRDCGT